MSCVALFFTTVVCLTEGWWSTVIKNARKTVKNKLSKYKKINTPENSTILQEARKHYQNLIEMSKLSFHKKQTEYLNQYRDATQFWHKYEKVIGRKTNNTVEQIFDSNSSTYIFDCEIISNRLHDYHIAKSALSLNFDDSFKMSVEEKLQQILNHVECDSSQIFFGEQHIRDAINKANKNSSPGPDKITSELILNGRKQVISAITLLLQAGYLIIGYFPKLWKMENCIYFKKMDKATYQIETSYRSISLTNLFGKIYERILQQATQTY